MKNLVQLCSSKMSEITVSREDDAVVQLITELCANSQYRQAYEICQQLEASQYKQDMLKMLEERNNKNKNELLVRIKQGIDTVCRYEILQYQQEALNVIDYNRIIHHINEYRIKKPDCNEEILFVQGLIAWFKRDFFKWCNKPSCIICNSSKNMSLIRNDSAKTANEIGPEYLVSRVEVYQCSICQNITRFPRYNNPKQLLYSRTGRCGEWANCFGLICRALNLDINYVIDFTDHVWVEIYIPSLNRFIHADPCELAIDTPHMYEKGWKKKLNHILSFSRYGVYDSISRYTSKYHELVMNRSEVYDETYIQQLIHEHDIVLQQRYSSSSSHGNDVVSNNNTMNMIALSIGSSAYSNQGDISVDTMLARKRILLDELKYLEINSNNKFKTEELQGRISGDSEWKESRGECNSNTSISYKLRNNSNTKSTISIPIAIDNDNNIVSTNIATPSGLIKTSSEDNYHYKYLVAPGGTHLDSEPFDIINDFLLNIISIIPSTTREEEDIYNSLVMEELVLFAGESFCNGIQINYRVNNNVISSPPYTSLQDDPIPHKIKLKLNEKIIQIIINAGSLVDGIKIITSLGNSLQVGGTGGDTYSYCIDDNEELIGFYGGIGGHLHHIGLVLRPISNHNNNISNDLMHQEICLLSQINNKIIENKLYYSLVPFDSGNYYHRVLSVLYFLIKNNNKLLIIECLQQYFLYSKNILGNLLDLKYRKIKFSNKYFMKIRNCLGGIALTTIGSLCMAMPLNKIDNECYIQSKIKLIQEGGGNQKENTLQYIERFNKLLTELVIMMQ